MKETGAESRLSTEDAVSLVDTDDVNALGGEARSSARRVTGDRVYHGSLTPAEEATGGAYAEVRLTERDAVEASAVDVFVGGRDAALGAGDGAADAYREAAETGVPVDVGVLYPGTDGAGSAEVLAKRLGLVDELAREDGVEARAVTLYPEGRTTAYTDLKAVAAARLCLDIVGVRVAREDGGPKLAQTALAYGANDLGFVDTDEGFDAELAAREAGFTAVDRAEAGGYGV